MAGWKLRLCRCLGELALGTSFLGERTFRRNRPDFHLHAIGKPGTIFGDSHGLVQSVDAQQKVTTDGFFGFGKWSVGNNAAIFSRNDFALRFEGVSSEGLALFS